MTIFFDKKFYNVKAIKNTIEAYRGTASFKIRTGKNIIKVEAGNIDKDVKNIFKDEFCNYVLSEMKKNKSQCA